MDFHDHHVKIKKKVVWLTHLNLSQDHNKKAEEDMDDGQHKDKGIKIKGISLLREITWVPFPEQ